MKKKTKILLYVCSVVVVLIGAAAFVAGRYWSDHVASNFSSNYVLYVYPDMTPDEIIDSLVCGAQAKRIGSLRRCAKETGLTNAFKPGRYVIGTSTSSIYAMRMIVSGWQSPLNMTLSGTIRKKNSIAAKIGKQMMVDSAEIASALDDSSFLASYGFTPENVFALFLPDTYQMYWTASCENIFDRFKKEYDRFWTEERLKKAAAQGLTPMQVSVLASIVNGETHKSFEYPVIAGVYLNRLRKGIKLQADPTIAFCFDYEPTRILKKHLSVDSPYNTYKYKGLPPAPINVPPKACIDAVLDPAVHNYLYFCADAQFNGTHKFARSYSEHLKNAREFQRELTRRRNSSATIRAAQ